MAQVVGRPYWKMCERCRVVEVRICPPGRGRSGQRQTQLGLVFLIRFLTLRLTLATISGSFLKKTYSNFKSCESWEEILSMNPFVLQNIMFTLIVLDISIFCFVVYIFLGKGVITIRTKHITLQITSCPQPHLFKLYLKGLTLFSFTCRAEMVKYSQWLQLITIMKFDWNILTNKSTRQI